MTCSILPVRPEKKKQKKGDHTALTFPVLKRLAFLPLTQAIGAVSEYEVRLLIMTIIFRPEPRQVDLPRGEGGEDVLAQGRPQVVGWNALTERKRLSGRATEKDLPTKGSRALGQSGGGVNRSNAPY